MSFDVLQQEVSDNTAHIVRKADGKQSLRNRHRHPPSVLISRSTHDLPVGQGIRDSGADVTEHELAAYDAPFPDRRYQAGARVFRDLAMVEPQMDGVAESQGSPTVLDPLVVAEAGHFLQEWGEPVTRAALRHFGDL